MKQKHHTKKGPGRQHMQGKLVPAKPVDTYPGGEDQRVMDEMEANIDAEDAQRGVGNA